MSKDEAFVKVKFPTAKRLRGGNQFQIWVMFLSFVGYKLATGRTEAVQCTKSCSRGTNENRWTVQHRSKVEKLGGWLPVYIIGETILDSIPALRCFYCGFDAGHGHDYACRYSWHGDKYSQRGKIGTADHIILVPTGGIPPSESMF